MVNLYFIYSKAVRLIGNKLTGMLSFFYYFGMFDEEELDQETWLCRTHLDDFHQLGPTGPSWSRSCHIRGSVCLSVNAVEFQGSKVGLR